MIGLVLFGGTIDTSSIPKSPQVEIQKKEELKTETNKQTNTNLKTNTSVKTQLEEKQASVSAEANKTPTPIKVEDKPVPTEAPKSSETVSQKNAVAKAKSYLGYSGFSHDGLVAQLEYEQFSHSDAVYGADNSGANWNEQAARKAKSYLDYSAFSRGSLIQQLKFEKFTQAQAEYGANAVGL